MIALLLAGCAGVNAIEVLDGAPRDLDPPESILWTDGPWYDTGEIARLLLSSGRVSCEDLQAIDLQTNAVSTVFLDEGLLIQLRLDRLDPADDDAPPGWEGVWTSAGYEGGWSWELESYVFHDKQLTETPADSWLSVDAYDGAGEVEGVLENSWYRAKYAAEHCGEMRTYILY